MTVRRGPLERRLVDDGVAADVEEARRLVLDGAVLVDGAPARSPRRQVAATDRVEVVRQPRYVSRGGDKLEAALDRLGLDVAGARALDVGSSTGGFTDCLLARGARHVVAIDVGRHQLHERLRADPRVTSIEETNVLDLDRSVLEVALDGPPDVVTVDVSFTSIERIIEHLVSLAGPDAALVVLVKPQFEADYGVVSKGRGVVRDPSAWQAVVDRSASAIQRAGAGIIGIVASPLAGAAGNREFFVGAVRAGPTHPVDWVRAAVAAAVAEVAP